MQSCSDLPPPPGVLGAASLALPGADLPGESASEPPCRAVPPPDWKLGDCCGDSGAIPGTCGAGVPMAEGGCGDGAAEGGDGTVVRGDSAGSCNNPGETRPEDRAPGEGDPAPLGGACASAGCIKTANPTLAAKARERLLRRFMEYRPLLRCPPPPKRERVRSRIVPVLAGVEPASGADVAQQGKRACAAPNAGSPGTLGREGFS
jgi:hypothetical protein